MYLAMVHGSLEKNESWERKQSRDQFVKARVESIKLCPIRVQGHTAPMDGVSGLRDKSPRS